jgi:Methionyl-tRNA formyltransferase
VQILFIGPYCEHLYKYLIEEGENVKQFNDMLKSKNDAVLRDVNFIISYRYRFIIPQDIVDEFKNRMINLHISFLPWNRGADPNLWSFLENTPAGVTIHYIDKGLDTGKIIVQKKVEFKQKDTLATTYNKLSNEIEKLFIDNWKKIRTCSIESKNQLGKGTYHRSNDKERYLYLLKNGWNTPVSEIKGKAEEKNGKKSIYR